MNDDEETDDYEQSKEFLHFEDEDELVRELIKMLNDQYDSSPEEEKNTYYDWIYWVLNKSYYDVEE
jgi:hypothetical protein